MNAGIFNMNRVDILKFPFPYKLWIVINLEPCHFIRWTWDGTGIVMELNQLDDYLASSISIFKIKNRSNFIEHMHEFGFKRNWDIPEISVNFLIVYSHEYFQRHRLDLVCNIYCLNPSKLNLCTGDEGNNDYHNVQEINHSEARLILLRLRGDSCFSFQGAISRLQRSRLMLQTISYFQKQTAQLEEKIEQSHLLPEETKRLLKMDISGRQRSNGSSIAQNTAMVNSILGLNNYENPYNSLSQWGNAVQVDDNKEPQTDHFKPDYAGYYGACSREQLVNFFGKYLPTFEEDSNEVKKIPHPVANIDDNNVEGGGSKRPAETTEVQTALDNNISTSLSTGAILPRKERSEMYTSTTENEQIAKDMENIYLNESTNEQLLENGNNNKTNERMTSLESTDDDCVTKNFKSDKVIQVTPKSTLASSSALIRTNSRNPDSYKKKFAKTTKLSKNTVGKIKNISDVSHKTVNSKSKETNKQQKLASKQSKEEWKQQDDRLFMEPFQLYTHKSEELQPISEDDESNGLNLFNTTPLALNQAMNREVNNLRMFCREYRSSLNVLYEHFG